VRLSRRLSQEPALPFLSGALWVTYSTLVLFDALLSACVLLALTGVVTAFRGNPARGWLTYGVGLGLGALAKGPVVLVHALPVALLAPWWSEGVSPAGWRRWYLGVMAALALGAAIGFGWALAAGARGGPAYEDAILWHQTAGRMMHAFAHRRPWWWYLPLIPLAVFPWGFWPPLWRSLAGGRSPADLASRFALACILPALVILSLISGKQIHYLMPLLPPFALLVAATMRDQVKARPRQVVILSLVSPVLLIVVHLVGMGLVRRKYDLRPSALMLKRAEDAGRPIGVVGRYEGQFHFLGRLEHPLDEVPPDGVDRWMAAHPNGLVVRSLRSGGAPAAAVIVQGNAPPSPK
jgi:4-amino-4-deoxy-L-arabinose transferase-like glycosyltransferase